MTKKYNFYGRVEKETEKAYGVRTCTVDHFAHLITGWNGDLYWCAKSITQIVEEIAYKNPEKGWSEELEDFEEETIFRIEQPHWCRPEVKRHFRR